MRRDNRDSARDNREPRPRQSRTAARRAAGRARCGGVLGALEAARRLGTV